MCHFTILDSDYDIRVAYDNRGLFLSCSPPPGGHRASSRCLVLVCCRPVWITLSVQWEPVAMALWRRRHSISVQE